MADLAPRFVMPADPEVIVRADDGNPAVLVGRDQTSALSAQYLRLDVLGSTLRMGPRHALALSEALARHALSLIEERGVCTSTAIH